MGEPTVSLHFKIPRSWHAELKRAAEANGLSVAALMRTIIRLWMRERFTEAEREALSA